MHFKPFNSIPGLYPPDASSTPNLNHDDQRCLQRLPGVPGVGVGAKWTPAEGHWHRSSDQLEEVTARHSHASLSGIYQ